MLSRKNVHSMGRYHSIITYDLRAELQNAQSFPIGPFIVNRQAIIWMPFRGQTEWEQANEQTGDGD